MDFFGRVASAVTNRISNLPVLVLMPHSRCNCRCVMCDIWKANHEKREISGEELQRHLPAFKKLGLKRVALSGGEALLHSNLWKLCELLHSIGVKISLLSTGVTLKANAAEVVRHCDDVIVSLDGAQEIHDRIRNIPGAYDKLNLGVKTLRSINPAFRITGRSVVQKQNFRDFYVIIQSSRSLGLDQISFLAADVSSVAFNRAEPWNADKKNEVALNLEEVEELGAILQKSFVDFREEYDSGFIAENQNKILAIYHYYRAMAGQGEFPNKKCNAPWVSAVIESNGDVLPCFFHQPYGNILNNSFEEIINSKNAVSFRKGLDIQENPTCQRCVCSLHVGATQSV